MMGLLSRSISARILALAAVNLGLLVVIALLASGVRLPRGPRDMLVQLAAPRLLDLSRQVALDLARTPPGEVDAVLRQFSERHAAEFVLALNTGERVAGSGLAIPREVVAAIMARGAGADEPRPGMPRDSGPPRGLPRRRIGEPGGRGPGRLPLAPPFLVVTPGAPRYWIGLRIPVQFAGDAIRAPGTLLLASSSLLGNGLLVPWAWLGWGALALGVTVGCWWPVLRGITTSLQRLERATEGMADGHFDPPRLARSDELGRLSTAMSHMGARLGALLSGQKRFLGDTAHELRSPLGRMQLALGILDARVPASERGYVRDLQEDVDAMSALTDELLQFARAELGQRALAPVPLPVAVVARRVAKREGAGGASILVTAPESLQVLADAALFERALANTVRNAVRYAAEAGPIEIAARVEGASAVITVRDAGPGVPGEAVDRLFEPFYRLDTARNRRTGGAGLGLAIVRSAIEACGGRVACRNLEPHGLEVQFGLPLA